ncbi:MAG: amidohydrolase family protein [Mycobacterium kyogaense]|uniref:amidohydrolase n=1 Tax=Mycobacterium kyogaense TaxID=2212479 RepID=UPI002FF72E0B
MPEATAMAVRDGVIAWLGSDGVGREQFPDAEIVDLAGGFVAPAFVDSHVHVTATGLSLTGLDLRAATSRRHCVDLLAAYARAHPDGVLWAHGWDESGWPESTPPTVEEVDAAVGSDRPAYLARVDVHSAVASTALQRAAGVSGQAPLTADAHHRVRRVAREHLSAIQRDDARRATLDLAASRGIVAVHECAGPDIGGLDDWRELRALEHGVDVVGYWGEAIDSADAARALIAETGAQGLAGDLFVDGALGSRTAWLTEPYADAPPGCTAPHGNAYLTVDAITAHLMACTEAGITAGFHVIGDAAVTAVVHALGAVVDALGSVAVARCGHRLEHLEMVTDEQAAQLGRWGVIASMQPVFDALWGGPRGMYAQRVGAARASAMNNFALLASQGVPLAFGSDAPVTEMDPWSAVRAATAHQTPGSAVSARAAFAAATRGAWRAGGARDGVTGTLVPGAPASYAVWDADDFDVSAPSDAVQRWSTDPRSRVPVLPRLDDGAPRCRQTVHRGAILHG